MEYLIKTKSIGGLTEDQFYQFCHENETIRFEMNPNGDLIIANRRGHTLVSTIRKLWPSCTSGIWKQKQDLLLIRVRGSLCQTMQFVRRMLHLFPGHVGTKIR
jgi:hypothetical protein